MHIPPGLLHPSVSIATAVASAATLAYAVRQVNRDTTGKTIPLMGVAAACVFAAQMINFPILVGPVSGHLLGSVLVTSLIGPWAGMIVMATVLTVQCLLFADGGIDALGANIFNLAVIGCLAGQCVMDMTCRFRQTNVTKLTGVILASWLTVLASTIVCSVEIAVGGNVALPMILGGMLLVHSVIGIGEALITGLAVGFILNSRPELIRYRSSTDLPGSLPSFLTGCLFTALVIATLLSPFASSLPDGLEWYVEKAGIQLQVTPIAFPAWMADYLTPGLANVHLAGSIAGGIGTVVCFAMTAVFGWSLHRRSSVSLPDVA